MIIKTLVENTSISDEFKNEHGLSLYIEAQGRKILFDTGRENLFLENAEKLDVDLSAVDILILSHAHQDHSGGLAAFLSVNKTAGVYIHAAAFNEYYTSRPQGKTAFIGIDPTLAAHPQIIRTTGHVVIQDGIELFSQVEWTHALPRSNQGLMMMQDGQLVEDRFAHEQNLILRQDNLAVLITGCAHNGILNILDAYRQLKQANPDYIIGGFHLQRPATGELEDEQTLDQIGQVLLDANVTCITGHCTGKAAYAHLKTRLQDAISYLATGRVIEI